MSISDVLDTELECTRIKGKKWIVNKCFSIKNPSFPNDKWVFGDTESKVFMLKLRNTSIKRHSMVPNGYSPDDPKLESL